ncbi:hypothetical protein ABZX12_22680 [Kribbella sp. NPDC003505]|uniref:hypothetical protein n=1 Tax=Kribbella sp. NPDC003505 TaxID=3154448 RepID=UPI0033AE8A32
MRRGVDQLIGVRAPWNVRVEPIAKEFDELATTCAGEELLLPVLWVAVEVSDVCFGHRVVQIRRTRDSVRLTVEELRKVGQVLAVPPHLRDRVQTRRVWVPVDQDELPVLVPGGRPAPLLEFDDDVRRSTRPRVTTREHDIGALRRQREVVFDQHLDLAELGLLEVLSQHRQTPLPRPDLCRPRPTTGMEVHLLSDPQGELLLKRQHHEPGTGLAEQRHE